MCDWSLCFPAHQSQHHHQAPEVKKIRVRKFACKFELVAILTLQDSLINIVGFNYPEPLVVKVAVLLKDGNSLVSEKVNLEAKQQATGPLPLHFTEDCGSSVAFCSNVDQVIVSVSTHLQPGRLPSGAALSFARPTYNPFDEKKSEDVIIRNPICVDSCNCGLNVVIRSVEVFTPTPALPSGKAVVFLVLPLPPFVDLTLKIGNLEFRGKSTNEFPTTITLLPTIGVVSCASIPTPSIGKLTFRVSYPPSSDAVDSCNSCTSTFAVHVKTPCHGGPTSPH